jgi:hypothetical protein
MAAITLLRQRLAKLGACVCMMICLSRSAAAEAASAPRAAASTGPGEEAPWSPESNGLCARLSMRRGEVNNGTAMIVTYLELKNARDLGSAMRLAGYAERMKFTVTDTEGREVPQTSGAFDGFSFDTPALVLPHDSALRFRIGPQGWGVPADQAALVDLGSSFGWVLPRDGKAYFLQGVLEIAEEKKGDRDHWHGRLELPRSRIPTAPEPVDPATLAARIEELGRKMLGKNYQEAEAATRELSLIDDPRVIPWYVKAVKTDSYELKFSALDRLSRFAGDEALDGLKIGMATQGRDIGNTTTAAVAASSAENIRHSAAVALARSPHPQARALLFSMEEDAATAPRITVIQAAAKMDSPESLALLKRRAQDVDQRVREEAARLLKLRESKASK